LDACTSSWLVTRTQLTIAPTALQRFFVGTESNTAAFWQNAFYFAVRTRDNMNADKFPYSTGSRRSGVGSRFNGPYISPDENGDIACSDVFLSHELHVRCLYHCVRGFDSANKSLGLDHA
jgi:hypothetical protein